MKNLRAIFEKGEFQKILEQVPLPGKTGEESEVLISALAFQGRLNEAEDLWVLREKHLSPEDKARARFALGLAALRASRFRSARTWFQANHLEAPVSVREYADQGIALFFYFTGRFRKASLRGRRALRGAIANGNTYVRSMATDLLGHACVQAGERFEGLRLLGQGVELAKASGRDNTAEFLEAEKLIYECQLGWHGSKAIPMLEKFLSDLHAQSSHTRGNLHLELGRQLTLSGQWEKARDVLNQGAIAVYQFNLRRQELTLQLRLAELADRQDDISMALHFVQAARRCLPQVADRSFEARILGMEIKLAEKFGTPARSNPKLARLLEITADDTSALNRQILGRQGLLVEAGSIRPGEDRLHDLFSLIPVSREQALQECLAQGWWGLVPQILQFKVQGTRLHLLRDRSLVGVRSQGVGYLSKALTEQGWRILSALKKGQGSKEQLVEAVWGYRYEPLRHDSLIYTAMTSLRKSLGEWQDLLHTSEQGWSLTGTLSSEEALEAEFAPVATEDAELSERLSFRQEKALGFLRRQERESWDIKSYSRHFKVSAMTAFRDLKTLTDEGYLLRKGRGRATCYLLLRRKEIQS